MTINNWASRGLRRVILRVHTRCVNARRYAFHMHFSHCNNSLVKLPGPRLLADKCHSGRRMHRSSAAVIVGVNTSMNSSFGMAVTASTSRT